MSREDLMKEIMEYAFVEKELNLFLDTNPTDKKALEMHQSIYSHAFKISGHFPLSIPDAVIDNIMEIILVCEKTEMPLAQKKNIFSSKF